VPNYQNHQVKVVFTKHNNFSDISVFYLELPHRNLSIDQQKDWSYRNQLALKEIGTKSLTRLESWSQQADLIQRKYRLEDDIMLKRVIVSDWLKTEIQDLHTSYKRGQQVMIELQKSLDSLLEQMNLVKGNVKMATIEVTSAAERLDDCVQELALACKRQDRNKSRLVAALGYGGLGDIAERPTETDNTMKEETKQIQPKKEGIEESTVVRHAKFVLLLFLLITFCIVCIYG
jgi:hypothetical protein